MLEIIFLTSLLTSSVDMFSFAAASMISLSEYNTKTGEDIFKALLSLLCSKFSPEEEVGFVEFGGVLDEKLLGTGDGLSHLRIFAPMIGIDWSSVW